MENQMKDYQDLLLRLSPSTPEDIRLVCLQLAARTGDPKYRHTSAILDRAAAFEEFVRGSDQLPKTGPEVGPPAQLSEGPARQERA
jgi:hypothetical protein